MRIVTLSDHVQTQIDAIRAAVEQDRIRQQKRFDAEHAKAKRAAEGQQDRYDAEYERATLAAIVQQEILDAAYEDAKVVAAERDDEIEAVRQEAARAWSDRQFRHSLGLRIRTLFMRRAPKPKRKTAPVPRRQRAKEPAPKVARARPSRQQEDEVRRLDDSWQGEQHLPRFLAERLGDEWVLVQGYRNARGETDFILVGPPGVCAIEVKYLNGVVYAKTDGSWRRDKYDNYGNLKETGEPIRDRGGRSPSQQVCEVASELERHLRRRMPELHLGVRTAVVLTHDRSRLGKMNASVDAVATLSDLKPHHLVPTTSAELSDHEVDEVVTLIAEDHRFHEERREQGSRRRGRRRGKPAKSPRN